MTNGIAYRPIETMQIPLSYLQTVIKVSSITAIKKDKTAHLFPNAIMIFTADRKVCNMDIV